MARLSEQELRRFRDRITVAKRMQEDVKPRFDRYLDYYRGKHPIRIEKPLDHVVVNYILPMIEIKVAALASASPVWRFVPRRPDHEIRALVWQAVMPWVWSEANIQPHIRAALKDAKLFGFGLVKIGYRFETDREMFYDLTPEQFMAARAGKPDGVLLPVPTELLELQGQFVARNPEAKILYDNVFAERVSPYRFCWDPEVDYLNLQRANWVIQQSVMDLEDVKRVKRYKGTSKLEGDRVWEYAQGNDATRTRYELPTDLKQTRARVTLWEVHDRRQNVIVTFAQERDEPLLVQDFPYEFEGYPFEVYHTYDVPDDWLPMGDVQHAAPMQDEKNLLRSRAATRVRRLVDKYALDENMLADGAMEALESDQEGAIVRLTRPLQGDGILGTRGFPNDLRAHEANIDRDFSTVTGQPEYARGVSAPGVETATEASILREMAGVRAQDDQGRWDDFLVRVGRKVKALVEQFYDNERIAQVSPEVARELQMAQMAAAFPGAEVMMGMRQAWVRFTREEIQAEADVQVEAGSSAFRNRILEQQRLTAQFAPLWNNPLVDQEELVKLYLTRATDLARERDRLVIPKAQLVAAQQAMQGGMQDEPGGAGGPAFEAPSGTEEGVARAMAQIGTPG